MNAPPTAELAQALFRESTDALLILDARTARIWQANAAAQHLLECDADSHCGIALYDLLVADSEDLHRLGLALSSAERWQAATGFALKHSNLPVELSVRPLKKGTALLCLRDTRARRALEARTSASETELALLLGAIPAAVWCAERLPDAPLPKPGEGLVGWQFRFLSPSVERVTGWPVSFFLDGPRRFAEIVHPDDRATILAERAAFLISPNTIFNAELRIVGADGFVRWIRCDMQATRDDAGQAVRLDCVLTDISRPKIAELSLSESQRWLTRLLETSTNGVLILDLAGRITLANRASEQMIGLSNAALLDRDWNDLPWESDRSQSMQAGADLAFRTLQNGELKLLRPDGRLVALSLNAAPLRDDAGRIVGVVVTLTDVSQRMQAEEAVRRSEERYRRLFERNLAGVCRYTLDGKLLDANASYARIFGFASAEEMRDVPDIMLHADTAERQRKIEQLVQDGFLTNLESRRLRNDGSEIWVLENVTLVEERGVPSVEATVVDITERKRAEQAIAGEHAQMRTLLQSIPDAIFFKDRDGRYLGCNPAFEEQMGLREGAIVGRTSADLFAADRASAMQIEEAKVYASGEPLRLEDQIDSPAGKRTIELLLHPMLDEAGTIVGLLGVGRDITERRHIEEHLRQAGKMEGIGQLAGGVAHDFNNLLTIILGNITLLRSMPQHADKANELLVDCEQAAQRASELTNHLLGFARRKPMTLQPLDLNRRVADTAQLLRRTVDPSIGIHFQPQADLWPIEADTSHVGQVLMNLCLNARDAIAPRDGQVRIETANIAFDDAGVRDNLSARRGEFVRLSVSDNGPGIPTEIRSRIFEPFFTTKPLGKGTGLGLAVVFGIVKQHNGWIECHSEPASDTRFDIYFPRSLTPISSPVSAAPTTARPGSETILLVDDEPMIRELARSILERFGYRVMLAEDGIVGLEVYRRHADEIDLIVLDLTMPIMSGRETFRRLRELNPHVGVVLSSGYSADEFEPGELEGVLGFVPKPYRVQDLANAVRAALDRIAQGDRDDRQ